MNYPITSDYLLALRSPEDNFKGLTSFRLVMDNKGEPVMSSGNFAVVFKMKDEKTEKFYAVKCFLKEQEGRAEAYRMIAEELEFVNSTFLTPIKYLDKELFVDTNNSDESEFPVLLMDWVEGQTLDKYIREHIDDEYELSLLAYQFSRLAMWLLPQPFAHGDLKPDNILVKDDGTLALVDYDGMYVPSMKGQKARELGSPDFRHPGRTEDVFDEHIDDFSLVSILLSLKAIAHQPELLEQYGALDRLLFSEKDYRNLSESQVMDALKTMMQDTELATLYSLFIHSSAQNNLSQTSFRLLDLKKPKVPKYENLSTTVTDEDLANAWIDEYKVMYSADRKRLLKAPRLLHQYSVRKGTKVICNNAFWGSFQYDDSSIIIPDGVQIIGKQAFCDCTGLDTITIPKSIKKIKFRAFEDCQYLKSIELSMGLIDIEEGVFGYCLRLSSITLPNSLISLGNWAFCNCKSLSSISIPKSVKEIGINLFFGCKELKEINVDKDNPFYDSRNNCNAVIETDSDSLIAICPNSIIPNNIRKICACGFGGLDDFSSFRITDNVEVIGDSAFEDCKKLVSIFIPENVRAIGKSAFKNCIELSKVTLNKGLKSIGDNAFDECYNLSNISFPNTLIKIGDYSFQYSDLICVKIPCEVKEIGLNPFKSCRKLISLSVNTENSCYDSREYCQAIIETKTNTIISACRNTIIPNGIEIIGETAFNGININSIDIPNSVKEIRVSAFASSDLISIIIPKSITNIEIGLFDGCEKLESITFPNSINSINGYEYFDGVDDDGFTFSDILECFGSQFYECNNLVAINIPKGTKKKFEDMFPCDKNLLLELNEDEILSTEVTDDDLANAWTDEHGAKYSSDRKRLLTAPDAIKNYLIKNGTIVICNNAFSQCRELQSVQFPNSVTAIGDFAFYNCVKLNSAIIPKSVKYMGVCVFEGCERLQHYHPFE